VQSPTDNQDLRMELPTDHPLYALGVFDDLSLVSDGRVPRVSMQGDRLFVDLPDLGAALRLVRTLAAYAPNRGPARAARALRAYGMTVEIRLRNEPLARLGADLDTAGRDGSVQLNGYHIWPAGLLRTTVQAHPGKTVAVLAGLCGLALFLRYAYRLARNDETAL
jgi:hypothetical protein